MDKDDDTETMSEKQMEALAKFFADRHQSNPTDYTLKYREMLKETDKKSEIISDTQESGTKEEILKCPKCGAEMVLRTAQKGENAGKNFMDVPGIQNAEESLISKMQIYKNPYK